MLNYQCYTFCLYYIISTTLLVLRFLIFTHPYYIANVTLAHRCYTTKITLSLLLQCYIISTTWPVFCFLTLPTLPMLHHIYFTTSVTLISTSLPMLHYYIANVTLFTSARLPVLHHLYFTTNVTLISTTSRVTLSHLYYQYYPIALPVLYHLPTTWCIWSLNIRLWIYLCQQCELNPLMSCVLFCTAVAW